MKNFTFKSKYLFFTSTIVLVILAWFIVSTIAKNEFIFPNIKQIFNSFIYIITHKEILMLLSIVLKVLLCVVISTLISLFIVILYMLKKETIAFFEPILTFFRVVPILGIIVYLFLVFNEIVTPYIITIIVIIPLMVEALKTAFDNLDPNLMDALKLEKISFFKKVFRVYLPIIAPYFFMALMQSFGLGIKSMIMGEYLCYTPNSIGSTLYDVKLSDSSMLIAWLILIFIVTAMIEVGIKKFKKTVEQKNLRGSNP